MGTYILRRTLQSIAVLILVSMLCFSFIHAMPGSPYMIKYPTPEQQLFINQMLHAKFLDRPIWIQYFHWINQMSHGNFGSSLPGNSSVFQAILQASKGTLRLVGVSWLLALAIAIPWGIHNSTKPYGISDHLSIFITFIGFGFPTFWIALMLQDWIAMRLFWLPPTSLHRPGHEAELLDLITHMIMPWLVMTFSLLVGYLKYARSSLMEVLPADYIRTARAKGASETRVVYHHALRNAMIPMITILAFELPTIIGSATLVETVFRLPGLGSMVVRAAQGRDYTTLMGCVIFVAVIVIIGNWLADILYVIVDPRVKMTRRKTELGTMG